MPLLLPVVLCVVGVGISLVPPADVQPVEGDGEGSGSWFAMTLAAAFVLLVCGVAVHRLAQPEPRSDAIAVRTAR